MSSIFLEVAPVSENADICNEIEKVAVLPLYIRRVYISFHQKSQTDSEVVELRNTEEIEKFFREKFKKEDDFRNLRTAISEHCFNVIMKHANQVSSYANGKTGLLGFFVGQVILATNGDIDPQLIAEIVKPLLDKAGADLHKKPFNVNPNQQW